MADKPQASSPQIIRDCSSNLLHGSCRSGLVPSAVLDMSQSQSVENKHCGEIHRVSRGEIVSHRGEAVCDGDSKCQAQALAEVA